MQFAKVRIKLNGVAVSGLVDPFGWRSRGFELRKEGSMVQWCVCL